MNNVKRLRDIDLYLKRLRDIAIENPNYYFSSSHIYHEITRFHLSPEDCRYSVRNTDFPRWISRFQNDPYLSVYVADNWRYFCQFVPKDETLHRQFKCHPNLIKLYISQDSKHLYQSANLIFDFISRNRIPVLAKIGSEIRCDDIVIRVQNQEDADKIMNFVRSNSYIQEGLLKYNPFLAIETGTGFAWDGSLSYHSVIANLVSEYINTRKREKQLSKVSVSDFYSFVNEIRYSIFGNELNAQKIFEQNPAFSPVGLFSDIISDTYDLYSLKGCLESFQKSFQVDYQLFDYYEGFLQMKSLESFFLQRRDAKLSDSEVLSLAERGFDALMKHFKKDRKQAICNFKEFARGGELRFLPTKVRPDYQNHHFADILRDYLVEHDMFIDSFIEKIDNNMEGQNVPSILRFIYALMSQKYGSTDAYRNICEFVRTGDYSLVTRDYQLRGYLQNHSAHKQIKHYLSQHGLEIEDVMQQIMNRHATKEAILEDACRCTYLKYEELEHTGIQSVINALQKLIMENCYLGFTRDMNSRQRLLENVTKRDVCELIAQKLQVDVQAILSSVHSPQLWFYCRDYVNALMENYINPSHKK